MPETTFDPTEALETLDTVGKDKLRPQAVENVRRWLTEPYLAEFAPQVAEHVAAGKWDVLDLRFYTTIPFGTGGRRGEMYPIGTNAINDRTIGESAAGLAEYVREHVDDRPLSCAIAYDTRHNSRHFAELCAEIMVAAGFQVYFLDGVRSTPALSFAVRHKSCACGIMVTASHNPPKDNAVKAYWKTGGQLVPPDDKAVIAQCERVTWIKRDDFQQSLEAGKIEYCQEEIDREFLECVVAQSHGGPRELKIIYSPLHGVGTSAVVPALQQAGFRDVEVFADHAEPSPDFPNVPKHSANPENPEVFDRIIQRAKQVGADLILATDPDCDRVGVAVPSTTDAGAPWVTLTGNQSGALMADYLLEVAKVSGKLTPEHYVVKTIVTTELIARITEHYGATMYGDLMVGFKWIGQEMDIRGPEKFLLGAEESYGYLVGDHARDKDAAVASLILGELAARLKAQGKTLRQKLDDLFRQHGCHAERLVSVYMSGAEGMERMRDLMKRVREKPPEQLGGLKVAGMRDLLEGPPEKTGLSQAALNARTANVVILDLEAAGNYVAIRPSGTEPKVKMYMFAYAPPQQSQDLEAAKQALSDRLTAVEDDFTAFAGV